MEELPAFACWSLSLRICVHLQTKMKDFRLLQREMDLFLVSQFLAVVPTAFLLPNIISKLQKVAMLCDSYLVN